VDFSLESTESCQILSGTQFTDADTASSDEIGQPKPPLRESPILPIGERRIDQARIEEQFPKAVRGARKMMSHGRRSDPWVDAHKQDSRSWSKVV